MEYFWQITKESILTYPFASFADLSRDDHHPSVSCCDGELNVVDSDVERRRSDLLAAPPKPLDLVGLKLTDPRPLCANLCVGSALRPAAFKGTPSNNEVETIECHDRIDLDTWLTGKKGANTSQQVAVAS
jgi:hypothetical protein